jgi:hypothetical protein
MGSRINGDVVFKHCNPNNFGIVGHWIVLEIHPPPPPLQPILQQLDHVQTFNDDNSIGFPPRRFPSWKKIRNVCMWSYITCAYFKEHTCTQTNNVV